MKMQQNKCLHFHMYWQRIFYAHLLCSKKKMQLTLLVLCYLLAGQISAELSTEKFYNLEPD